MKQLKKWISALLCMALALCLALPAWAEVPEETQKYTLTIKSETPGHTYQAYQVFSGTLAKDPANQNTNTLVDLAWGSGVKEDQQEALVAAIRAITVTESSVPKQPFAACNDVNAIAAVLTLENDNSELLDAFADVVADYDDATDQYKYLNDANKKTGTTSVVPETDKTYKATISDLPAGYYLVKEAPFNDGESEGKAYTKYMLNLVESVEVEAKAEVPTLDKQVQDKDDGSANPEDATNVSVGDKVTYTLTSKVPAMDGYETYYFIVNDTLSKGLTLDQNSIAINIVDSDEPHTVQQTLTKDTHFTVTTSNGPEDGETSLKIVFKNFIQWKERYTNEDIVITYDATLDQDAVIGNLGNQNDAKLTYSNDPNYKYTGKPGNPDEPNPDEPVGVTPSSKTNVYTTQIQLNKVDEYGRPLTGAEFTIEGDGVVITGVTTTNNFEPAANGTYYKLKNGAYTTTPPVTSGGEDDTSALYESTSQKYKKSEPTTRWITKGTTTKVTGTVGADGVVTFEGLGAGTYTITETKTPANYNTIDPIELTISCDVPDEIVTGEEQCTWSATYRVGDGSADTVTADGNGTISINVENRSGTQLPSTGGIGTTIFLWGGAGLMLAVLLLLGLRIRSKKEENDRI